MWRVEQKDVTDRPGSDRVIMSYWYTSGAGGRAFFSTIKADMEWLVARLNACEQEVDNVDTGS